MIFTGMKNRANAKTYELRKFFLGRRKEKTQKGRKTKNIARTLGNTENAAMI
ncbi:MAG TPA: hypothetical protein VJB12_01305 [Candidatus Nanoarchaeia archaeon]|nr:hypothetical protein [Candidatus Nanoarchaeia archaeon]